MFRKSLVICALAACAAPAVAQNNEASLEQRGSGNELTIDQTNAVGSSVGGLTIERLTPPVAGFVRPLIANALSINVPPSQRTLQLGSDNQAAIDISSSGGNAPNDVGMVQSGVLNSATVNLDGSGLLASIAQAGFDNEATLNLRDSGSRGTIVQVGTGNEAELRVSGGNEGYVGQFGNRNNAGTVTVEGPDAAVTYIQIGNNLQPASNTGVSVFTNAGAVTITQTGFGGVN